MGYLSKGDRITQAEQDLIDIIGVLGTAGQVLRVNGAGTSIEWATAGAGTVTSVSVVTANGVSGSVATSTSTPAITLTLGSITPSAVNISGLTASEIVITDGSKNLVSAAVATYPSLTELSYVKGLSSAVQTQITAKAPSTSPTFATSITGSYLTASEILITDGSKNIVSAAVATYPSLTELTYVKGVTSAIQTQFTAKAGTALSNLASVAINTTLLSDTDNTDALGTTAVAWSDLFLGSGAVITFNSAPSTADITITHSADTLTFAGGTIVLGVATATSYNGMTITTSTGTFTLTNAKTFAVTNTLTLSGTDSTVMTFPTTSATIARIDAANTFVGASTASAWVMTSPTITTSIVPTTDDGAALGSATNQFADLFLASGGLIKFASTDWIATHSAGVLTVSTGDLRVTTAGTNTASVVTVGGTQTLTSKTLTSPTLTTPSAFTTGGTITLAENTSIALDPAGSADGKYTGITIAGTAGATLAFGDLIYLAVADSRWELADADATATAGTPLIGMCVLAAAADADPTTILLYGQIRADAKFPALTIGAPVYVGETAGAIQVAIPTGADNVIRVVGRALTADEILFNPSQDHQITVA